ncbi:MAG: hypothetical protein DWQ20_00690 [Actinobacteria bacterium]|nr:MAG: hypothetical protein DWQ20_00690 [Actinomycetota bacterium]
MSFRSLLNQTATIKRRSATQSTSSGGAKYPVTTVCDAPCRIQMDSSSEASIGGRASATAQGTGYFLFGADIRSGDYIEAGGLAYEVVGPPRNAGGHNHHLEVTLTEARPNL